MSFEQIFGDLVRTEPSRPFVTHYDEPSGARAELSVRSLANWVVKTHHLIVDELGLGPGDAAHVDLPQHWISVPVLLACATSGVRLSAHPAEADVAFVAAATPVPGVDTFVVDAEAAARGRTGTAPAGARDYAEAVRPHPDTWPTLTLGAGPQDEFLDGASREHNLSHAHERAVDLGITDHARVLSTRTWRGSADWMDCLFAPLAVRGSLVYLTAPDADQALVRRRAEQERVDTVLT